MFSDVSTESYPGLRAKWPLNLSNFNKNGTISIVLVDKVQFLTHRKHVSITNVRLLTL
jgi:hypothetical protein